jgi:tetratricopeptide (TPR) repeat protein
MSDNPRIDELKRRVQQDPASIAFAALADEYRRAGLFHDAVETCRAGLQRHPAYVSARVTLGRSLVELGEFQEATEHLEQVLRSAPENLAAIRALADLHRRNGEPLESTIQAAAAAESASQTPTVAPPARAAQPAPVIPAVAVAQQARAVSPIPVTQAVPVAPPAPARAALKPVTLSADSHQSIALVTLAAEPDGDGLEIADLAPTMADAQLPVIRELEQLLAGISRARQAIDSLNA